LYLSKVTNGLFYEERGRVRLEADSKTAKSLVLADGRKKLYTKKN
jgi:hypothetical protein